MDIHTPSPPPNLRLTCCPGCWAITTIVLYISHIFRQSQLLTQFTEDAKHMDFFCFNRLYKKYLLYKIYLPFFWVKLFPGLIFLHWNCGRIVGLGSHPLYCLVHQAIASHWNNGCDFIWLWILVKSKHRALSFWSGNCLDVKWMRSIQVSMKL